MSGNDSGVHVEPMSPLQRLPEFDPDPALWSRILSRRLQMVNRRQRRNRWLATGLSAAAVLCVVVVSRVQPGLQQADDVAAWQRQSQQLEAEWLTLSRSMPDPRARAELRLIDLELQTAYDRGATASDLIPLWKLRSEALRELIDNDLSRVRSVTRL